MSYIFFLRLGFVFASESVQLGLEHVVELLTQCLEVGVVGILDVASTNNGFEELSLQDNPSIQKLQKLTHLNKDQEIFRTYLVA